MTPMCHIALVANIAGSNDLPARVGGVDRIRGHYLHHDIVQRGVGGNGGRGEMVDLGREHGAGAGFRGGDCDQSRAGAEIDHKAPGYRLGTIEQVAGECLATGPGECPKRRRHAAARQAFFARLPDRGNLGCQMEPDLG
jgi:hypothetical protein